MAPEVCVPPDSPNTQVWGLVEAAEPPSQARIQTVKELSHLGAK